jgi:hypothetical protein
MIFFQANRRNRIMNAKVNDIHNSPDIVIYFCQSSSYMWYQFLNIFFFVFHTIFTLFNMTGWIFRNTRRWNLITLSLTAFSWFVLGIWYGWGYCFCTQWHWDVRRRLGYENESHSYIHFLILKLTGINFPPQLVENITGIIFLVCLSLSVWLNIKDHYRKRKG